MSQCVPSWDAIDETPPRPSSSLQLRHECPSSSAALLVPLTNYEVAELTWENGQLSLHGFGGSPRVAKHGFKCPSSTSAAGAWTKPPLPIDDTLEAVVSQSTGSKIFPEVVVSQSTGSKICPEAAAADAVIPTLGLDDYLFEPPRQPIATAATDALVPCRDGPVSGGEQVRQSATAGAGAGRGTGKKRPRPIRVCSSQGSADVPATRRRRGESALVTIDSRGMTDDFELTTTTATETATATTTMATNSVSLDEGGYGWPEADSVSQSTRPQLKRYDMCEEEAKTCKKTRATAVHNQSERKRRDRINQKMKTLQKLVPNSTKSDKASILDEVIDYLKHLQAQVQVIKRMNSFMMPMPMSTPQFQMSMMANMAHMAQMAQLSMGMMDATATASAISRPATYSAGLPPALHHQPPTFLPLNGGTAAAAAWDYYGDPMQPPPGASSADALSALLACQNAHQPAASMDAYNTMATLFQQLHQQPPSNSMT